MPKIEEDGKIWLRRPELYKEDVEPYKKRRRMHNSFILLSSGILYNSLQRVTTPDAVIIKFVLLKMGMLILETCRGL